MFASLMGIALRLTDRSIIQKDDLQVKIINKFNEPSRRSLLESRGMTPEAIMFYAEYMHCLIYKGNDSSMLMKVFLVFHMMRNAGAMPNLAFYNVPL
jgi:hypothetical protein